MEFHIEINEELSGEAAKIYTIREKGDELTSLEHFVDDNIEKYPQEVGNILSKLETMGHDTGCEYNFFKHNEGHYGDGIVVLKDESKRFRLYCMYFGEKLLVCGSGGFKSPSIRAYQEDAILAGQAEKMKEVAAKINKSIEKKQLDINSDGTIDFYTEDYD